jgi:DNA-binding CsgD family transcriptional regulator
VKPFQKILEAIKVIEVQEKNLNMEDTITILVAFKKISNNETIIEKAIYLLLVVNNQSAYNDKLSKRENQIFKLIGAGYKSKEIALILAISKSTVSTHRKNIIKKLKLKGSGNLQNIAYQKAQENL